MDDIAHLAEHLEEITVKRPSDLIIEQIRSLITSGVLNPGQRLPSERLLSERFGVGRGHVREALRKLEFYGIVRTLPQSGTVVERIGVKALDGLITNVLGLEGAIDYKALYEVRDMLEIHAARLAAIRGSRALVAMIGRAFDAHKATVRAGNAGLDEDAMFHLKIAEASGNILLRTLISLMTPDIIMLSEELDTCREGRAEEAMREHERILAGIRKRDPEAAAEAMTHHIIQSRQQHERLLGEAGLSAKKTKNMPVSRGQAG